MGEDPVSLLVLKVAMLACVAVGGYITTVGDLQRFVVVEHGWLTAEMFVTLFAVAQAAPGPNFLVVTLLGWTLGGALGAFLVTCAAILPTMVMAYFLAEPWERYREARWRMIVARTIAPIAVGMMLATGAILTQSAWADDWRRLAITFATAIFFIFTRYNPLVPLAFAAILGALSLV